MLSQEQIAQFRDDGYLVIRGLFDSEEMGTISAWADELAAAPEVPGGAMKYFEDGREAGSRLLSRIENFVPWHAGFRELITGRRIRQAVDDLFGEAAVLFKDKINYKLPGAAGFKAHQDVQAGWDVYAGLHVTAMVAIDATDEANGSLEMIPGLHREGLLGQMWAPLTDADTAGRAYVPVHCRRGDAVFFDSYTPHRSGANQSQLARRVLYITYNKASEGDHRARYYADKRKSYPPDIEREAGKDYAFKV
jgi:hypothetical protein